MSDNKFIKIMSNYLKVDEYIKFMRSPQFVVYMFLRNAIIRESAGLVELKKNTMSTGAGRIYTTYFRKGKLVSTYSLNNVAEYLGMNKSNVSRHVNKLNDDGFIKIHKRNTPLGQANDYEFGVYTGQFGSGNYKEHHYADQYFDKLYNERKNTKNLEISEDYTIEMYIEENKHVYGHLNIDDTWSGLNIMRAFNNKLDYITYKQCDCGRFLTEEEKETLGDRWMCSYKTKTSVG